MAYDDFYQKIRNIGFRLLDEPSNVSVEYEDEPTPPTPTALYDWDFTQSLIDSVEGEEITLSNATRNENGIVFTAANHCAYISTSLLNYEREYDITFSTFYADNGGNRQVFTFGNNRQGLYFRYGTWGTWDATNGWQMTSNTDRGYFENSTLRIVITSDHKWHIYKDDTLFFEPENAITLDNSKFSLGAWQDSCYNMTITAFKIYAVNE